MSDHTDRESIVIDPVAMNIVNRVAAGCRHAGSFHCRGGLMVEGCIEGEIEVLEGPLVLMPEGVIAGKITAHGDAYLFGTVRASSETQATQLQVHGAVFLAETLRAQADISAAAIKCYEGAQVEGRISTAKRSS